MKTTTFGTSENKHLIKENCFYTTYKFRERKAETEWKNYDACIKNTATMHHASRCKFRVKLSQHQSNIPKRNRENSN